MEYNFIKVHKNVVQDPSNNISIVTYENRLSGKLGNKYDVVSIVKTFL